MPDLVHLLARPPWHVATTAELAAATNVPFGRLSNWIQRGQWPKAEPRHLYRLDGNKRVFRIDTVVEWLTGAAPAVQAMTYLEQVGLTPQSGDVWRHVRMLERVGVFAHRWEPRDPDGYIATLK